MLLRLILPSLIAIAMLGCMTTNDERWRGYNDDGVHLFAAGEFGKALECFDLALTLHPHDSVILYNMGQCYERQGDLPRAEQYYASCVERDAKHADARLALITIQYRTGRTGAANLVIEDWLKQQPTTADALVADAWRLRQQRAIPAAQARLHQALSLDRNNRRALTELAILYELQGLPDRSLALYEQILEREPTQIDIADRVAQLRARGVKLPTPK
ncbi:MAG: tetratricopeptide repeat protein [Gemmataceae bacterium]|nr:tetratricopeptide repeat protein [Gemmataceae bacterium]